MAVAIIDIDGTLVDSNYQHADAWYRAFKQCGVTVPYWKIHKHVGMGGDQLVPALLGERKAAEVEDDVRAAEKTLFKELIDLVEPFEGATGLLREIKRRGHRIVLASSASERDVGHFLDLLDARDVVDGWTTSGDVDATKPDPELVQVAIAKAGCSPSEAVMIGDTTWDVEAAERAGVPTICVLTGGFAEAELEAAGAIAVFESVATLCEGLDGTTLA